jgi:hypothetical protein
MRTTFHRAPNILIAMNGLSGAGGKWKHPEELGPFLYQF